MDPMIEKFGTISPEIGNCRQTFLFALCPKIRKLCKIHGSFFSSIFDQPERKLMVAIFFHFVARLFNL